jgi:hypothetical protein
MHCEFEDSEGLERLERVLCMVSENEVMLDLARVNTYQQLLGVIKSCWPVGQPSIFKPEARQRKLL